MTKYSVKKPYTVLVGVVLALVLGVVSFLGLNTDLLPAMDLPYVVVYTVYPGASPERVELAVTQPLEQAVATTSGLENISSISSENLSLIIMEFNAKTNMDSAMIELSNNIDMVEGYLDDMVQSPTLMKINPDMLPVQMLSVDVEGMDIKQLSEYVETDLAPRLERLDGVATVDISGAVHDYVEIKLNQEKIDAINDDILKAVSGKLYKTKKDLDKAQAELTNGKNSLVSAQQQAIDQLAAASAELDLNQAKLQSMVTEKDKLTAQLQLLEGLKGYATLVTIDKGVDALVQLMGATELGVNPDTTVGQVRDFFESLEIPESLPMALQVFYTTAQPKIDDVLLQEGQLQSEGVLYVTAFCLTADDRSPVISFTEPVPFSKTEAVSGLRPDHKAQVSAHMERIKSELQSERRLDMMAELVLDVEVLEEKMQELVTDLALSEAEEAELPSMALCFVQTGEDVWNVGKRYRVRPEEMELLGDRTVLIVK